MKLNSTFLDLVMPDYRELDDELRNRHVKKLMRRFRQESPHPQANTTA